MDIIDSTTKITTKTIVPMKSHLSTPRLVRKTESACPKIPPKPPPLTCNRMARIRGYGHYYLNDTQSSFHLFFP